MTNRATAIKRIHREMAELEREPVMMCNAAPKGNSFFNWFGAIRGPPGTPYEGGIFYLDIAFPIDYPFKPPKCQFTTPIYHPNVSLEGAVCLDLLQAAVWSPALTITKVLLCLCSILAEPDNDDPLNTAAAHLAKTDPATFTTTARNHTRDHAHPRDLDLTITPVPTTTI